jgi:alanine dehydrogenase
MIVGVPKEIKEEENHVAITPTGVAAFIAHGHRVLMQKNAGSGSGISDRFYEGAGATILDSAAEVWRGANLIMKVKEPLPSEFQFLREGLILFTHLHLAANETLTRVLREKQVTAIAYVTTLMSNRANVEEEVVDADLVIGTVLIPGAKTPELITRSMVKLMKPGAALVDISIDQGGCAETFRPTTHRDPIYVEEEVVHYCVTNMPAIVPHTPTYALTNATLSYGLLLADKGIPRALREDRALAKGLNAYRGKITHGGVAAAFGLKATPVTEAIAA